MKPVTLILSAVVLLSTAACTPAANQSRTNNPQGFSILNAQNTGQTYISRPDLAEQVMRKVPGISSAVVVVRQRTAYVAVNEAVQNQYGMAGRAANYQTARDNNGTPSTLSAATQQRIEDVVRNADRSIGNVYSSNNPALISRFNRYQSTGPKPIETVNDLSEIIQRVFPAAIRK